MAMTFSRSFSSSGRGLPLAPRLAWPRGRRAHAEEGQAAQVGCSYITPKWVDIQACIITCWTSEPTVSGYTKRNNNGVR